MARCLTSRSTSPRARIRSPRLVNVDVIQISNREAVGGGGLAVSKERVLSGSESASRVQGVLVGPDELRSRVGVLVLAGSSGRVDVVRARSFAQLGAVALVQRWFGGSGQAKGICEIPVEEFVRGVDLLVEVGASGVVVVGVSRGAEGALHLAVVDDRVDGVVALSPSSVSWANVGPGIEGQMAPARSSWSWCGEPIPFVPYDPAWVDPDPPVSYRALYESSLVVFAERVGVASIPIERARAEIVAVAGGDGQMWPSLLFAQQLEGRGGGGRCYFRWGKDAGHRSSVPGEAAFSDRAGGCVYCGVE